MRQKNNAHAATRASRRGVNMMYVDTYHTLIIRTKRHIVKVPQETVEDVLAGIATFIGIIVLPVIILALGV